METARLVLAASQLRVGPVSARCFPFPSFFAMADKRSPPKPGGRCMHKLTPDLGTVCDSPPREGGFPRRPRERWMPSFLPLSLSYEHCFSFNWFHSWRPFAKCNYARLSPSVCVQKEPSLSLFLSSIFISALIPTLQLTCTTMSRTS